MHRFFVPPELLTNLAPDGLPQYVTFPKELAHQVRDVIRLDIGEQLLLLDNSGDEILATVATLNKAAVEVQLHARRQGRSESSVHITLCQGLLKSARFEWILEKGTELGVSVFSPIISRRTMTGLEYTGPTKIQRWRRIIQEAAEQSGRSRLPELQPIRSLVDALNHIPPGALALMPWEEEHAHTLHNVLTTSIHPDGSVGPPLADDRATPVRSTIAPQLTTAQSMQPPPQQTPTTVVLFIGPEGGLAAEEIILAKQHGVHIVTLGSHVLRAETAALATVANVMYELEQ
jgi:16S rRNA (uracil1498-N3)-methyltransferase